MAGNDDISQWFLPDSERSSLGNPILSGNDATYFIEYRDYYKSLAESIEAALVDRNGVLNVFSIWFRKAAIAGYPFTCKYIKYLQ
jgi:hypothetical protein